MIESAWMDPADQAASTVITYVVEYPGTNLVKIGQTKYYADRFSQLANGSPIYPVPVCAFRGAEHEHRLHQRFAHLEHHNEFFYYTSELRTYLASDEAAQHHRMTHEEARAFSPRVPRRAKGPKPDLEPSLESNE
jgi:hypothetical protein